VPAALAALPAFVRQARHATPPAPIANTLYALAAALGENLALWRELAQVLAGSPAERAAVRETYRTMRLDELSSIGAQILDSDPPDSPGMQPFATVYAEDGAAAVAHAVARIGDRRLLEPAA
jgi:hypothetical protein